MSEGTSLRKYIHKEEQWPAAMGTGQDMWCKHNKTLAVRAGRCPSSQPLSTCSPQLPAPQHAHRCSLRHSLTWAPPALTCRRLRCSDTASMLASPCSRPLCDTLTSCRPSRCCTRSHPALAISSRLHGGMRLSGVACLAQPKVASGATGLEEQREMLMSNYCSLGK